MKWTKITIETTTDATDMLSYELSEYGVCGIEVEDKIPLSEEDRKAMFIDILPELPHDDGVAYVSCYIDADEGSVDGDGNGNDSQSDGNTDRDNHMDMGELCRYIREKLDEMSEYMNVGTGRISIGETEDRDWINNWKEFFHPFRIYDNIVIQPTWTEKADTTDDDIVIKIDPGTAFGTGSHETTKLCIGGLKKYMEKFSIVHGAHEDTHTGISVLDAGCGSGILSIIAAKFGASRICGVDIDELAIKASNDNMALNEIDKDVYEFVKGDIIGDPSMAAKLTKDGKYDIVVANILADVIVPLSGVIRSFMKEDGIFISSGIIDTKEEEVSRALIDNGFDILDVSRLGEWVSITAR